MRKINVKRLVALGTGIAFLGAALAPMASAITLSRGDIINTTNGMPAVDIVVGSNAAPSDAVWAGNTAAKVAQLAYTETSVKATPKWKEGTTPGKGVEPKATVSDLSVDLVIGGETTYAQGTAYTFDDSYLNSVSTTPEVSAQELSNSKLNSLVNSTYTYTYNGSSYTQTVKEYIGLTANAKFDTYKDVKDLVAYIDQGNFYYKVSFSAGIPYPFTKADQNTISVPFFGKKYTVLKATSNEVKLIDESNKYTYYNGERITGLTGKGSYAGQKLEVEFVTLTYNQANGTYYAKFNLYDSKGNLIDTRDGVSADSFLENTFYVNGEYPLETSIYVQSLGKEDVSGKGYIVVTVGTNTIQLKNGDMYPYDPTVTSSNKKYWKVSLHTSTGNVGNESGRPVIDYIKIYNAGIEGYSKWNKKLPIYASENSLTGNGDKSTAVFLNGEPEDTLGYGFAKVKFYGFKGTEPVTELKIANEKIYYVDSGDTQHEIPLYISGLSSTTEQEFSFDKLGNQKYYFKLSETDKNVSVTTSTKLNGVTVSSLVCPYGTTDNGTVTTTLGTYTIPHGLSAGDYFTIDGVKYKYVSCTTATDHNTLKVTANGYFQLADTSLDNWTPSSDSVSGYNGKPADYNFYFGYNTAPLDGNKMAVVKLVGDNDASYYYGYVFDGSDVWLLFSPLTSLSEKNSYGLTFAGTDTDEDTTVDVLAYVPNVSELGGGKSGEYYIAKFTYAEPHSAGTGTLYIDTEDGSLPPIGATDLSSNYTYEFSYTNSNTNQSLNMTNYNAKDNIQTAYSDYGTKFDISKDYFDAIIPENREKVKLVVEGPKATTTTTGETLSGAEGDTVTTTAGTKITIKKINYKTEVTPSVCPAGGVTLDNVEVTVTPSTVKQIVPVGQLVYLDKDAGKKPHIIVGGWKVNKLAPKKLVLSDGKLLSERLTKAGDRVVDKLENGDIIVAGYTAADTVAAAKELVNDLGKLTE